MGIMRKNYFVLLLAFILLFSLTACGGSDENDEVTPDASEEITNVLVSGEDIQEYDEGLGPVIIESSYGSIAIPEGLDYKLYSDPSKEGTEYIRIYFGKGNTNAGGIFVDNSSTVTSIDDVVDQCFWLNGYDVDPVIGKDVTYGGRTYKSVTIENPELNDIDYYLVSYYKTDEGKDGYIEVSANGNEEYDTIDIDDPLIVEMLERLVLN